MWQCVLALARNMVFVACRVKLEFVQKGHVRQHTFDGTVLYAFSVSWMDGCTLLNLSLATFDMWLQTLLQRARLAMVRLHGRINQTVCSVC